MRVLLFSKTRACYAHSKYLPLFLRCAVGFVRYCSVTIKPLAGCVLGCALLQFAAAANDIEPSKEFYTAIHRVIPMTVDGNLSDWTDVPSLGNPKFAVPKGSGSTLASPNYVLFEPYGGGIWSGPDDQSSAVQIVWDEDNLYFGFTVTDDYHENSANSAWNGDSLQLMIADGTRSHQIALYNYALGGIEGSLGDVSIDHEAGPAAASDCNCNTVALINRDGINKKNVLRD